MDPRSNIEHVPLWLAAAIACALLAFAAAAHCPRSSAARVTPAERTRSTRSFLGILFIATALTLVVATTLLLVRFVRPTRALLLSRFAIPPDDELACVAFRDGKEDDARLTYASVRRHSVDLGSYVDRTLASIARKLDRKAPGVADLTTAEFSNVVVGAFERPQETAAAGAPPSFATIVEAEISVATAADALLDTDEIAVVVPADRSAQLSWLTWARVQSRTGRHVELCGLDFRDHEETKPHVASIREAQLYAGTIAFWALIEGELTSPEQFPFRVSTSLRGDEIPSRVAPDRLLSDELFPRVGVQRQWIRVSRPVDSALSGDERLTLFAHDDRVRADVHVGPPPVVMLSVASASADTLAQALAATSRQCHPDATRDATLNALCADVELAGMSMPAIVDMHTTPAVEAREQSLIVSLAPGAQHCSVREQALLTRVGRDSPAIASSFDDLAARALQLHGDDCEGMLPLRVPPQKTYESYVSRDVDWETFGGWERQGETGVAEVGVAIERDTLLASSKHYDPVALVSAVRFAAVAANRSVEPGRVEPEHAMQAAYGPRVLGADLRAARESRTRTLLLLAALAFVAYFGSIIATGIVRNRPGRRWG